MTEYKNFVKILKRKIYKNKDNLLFVCIGTNKIMYDSIGPLTGSFLQRKLDKNMVIGNMEKTFCSRYDFISNYSKIKDKFIVAIDVALSTKELMGEIFISEKPIIMGLSLNKNKGKIGNIGIKIAISNLYNLDKNYIENKAKFISCAILEAIR